LVAGFDAFLPEEPPGDRSSSIDGASMSSSSIMAGAVGRAAGRDSRGVSMVRGYLSGKGAEVLRQLDRHVGAARLAAADTADTAMTHTVTPATSCPATTAAQGVAACMSVAAGGSDMDAMNRMAKSSMSALTRHDKRAATKDDKRPVTGDSISTPPSSTTTASKGGGCPFLVGFSNGGASSHAGAAAVGDAARSRQGQEEGGGMQGSALGSKVRGSRVRVGGPGSVDEMESNNVNQVHIVGRGGAVGGDTHAGTSKVVEETVAQLKGAWVELLSILEVCVVVYLRV